MMAMPPLAVVLSLFGFLNLISLLSDQMVPCATFILAILLDGKHVFKVFPLEPWPPSLPPPVLFLTLISISGPLAILFSLSLSLMPVNSVGVFIFVVLLLVPRVINP